ncbi:hypothetical protein R1sor_007067 [Riccia sorocarpa]|uniref:Exonuclease domain-containing protein n=1 Tax=Riccia sorocarpa TaxID=122646 RepID=A0ABD3HTI1_9MARC
MSMGRGRFQNPFTALSLVEDDEEFRASENNSKGQNSSIKSGDKNNNNKSEDPRSKVNENGVQHLYRPLVWIDLEMTGLDIKKDRILEIACVITDGKLDKVIEGPDLIINQPDDALAGMNDWCQEHHTASGLVEGVRRSTISEQEAEQQVLDFVNQYVIGGKAQIAGNSVYVDLQFIKKYMPKLAEIFSHIVVDVSSVRALCVRWFPHDADRAPEKKKNHRALDDIMESIEELRYMKKSIFKKTRS